MNCVIYVRDNADISIYAQFNEVARYAKRYGYSIKERVLDFDGSRFYKTIDKVIFDNEVDCLLVYNMKSVGDHETYIFYNIYCGRFGKKLISCN